MSISPPAMESDWESNQDEWLQVPSPISPEEQHINKIRGNRGFGDKQIPEDMISNFEQACIVVANQLYEAPTHFLLEMIQNANDNKFEEAEPTLVISYTGRHIQIECNEVGFTAENVDAICSIARSSKKRPGDTTSYVGEKGIGFKSVFRVADVVWVSSRAYSFKFDSRSRLGMITPILDQFPVATRPGWTSFYLQLRENDESAKMQAAIRFDLATFDARMLLFLRNLQTIHIVLDQGGQQLVEESSSRMYRRYDGKWNGFCMRNLTQGDETKRYVLQKHTLELENLAINEPRRDGATSTEVALAFPIQGDEPVVAPQQVFAFLPINDFGFSAILQADFLLTANREGVERVNPWNQALRNGLVQAFRIAATRFQNTPLAYTWIRYVPEPSLSGGFFDKLKREICKDLAQQAVLRGWNESPQQPGKVLYIPEKFRGCDGVPFTLRSENEALYLSGMYKDADIKYLKRLGVKEMDGTDFIHHLEVLMDKSFSDFASKPMASHSGLAAALNGLLANWSLEATQLSKLRLIKLRTGEWVPSGAGSEVFFPSDHDWTIPGGIGVKVVDTEAASDPAIRQLYSRLGVTPFGVSAIWKEITEIHAVDSKPTSISRNELVSQLHFLFTTRWTNTDKVKLWIVTDKERLVRAGETYIDDHDSDNPCVATKVFSRWREIVNFLHPDYLSANSKDQKSWIKWLEESLGMMRIPRLVSADCPWKLSDDFRFLVRSFPPERWLEVLCRHWKDYEKWLGPNETGGTECSENMAEGGDPNRLRTEIGKAEVKCKDEKSYPLSATFLPLEGYMSACGGFGPLLPISDPGHLRWQVLKLLGVGVESDARFYLRCLSEKAGQPVKLATVTFLLNQIEAHSTGRESDIRNEFSGEKAMIFVPKPEILKRQEQRQKQRTSALGSNLPQDDDTEDDDTENEDWDAADSEESVAQGTWYHASRCVWDGPSYFRVTPSLRSVYAGNRRLFVEVLQLGRVDFCHFNSELSSFKASDPRPYIRKVLTATAKFIGSHGSANWYYYHSRLADLKVWPVRMPAAEATSEADSESGTEIQLVSNSEPGGWFIADRRNYRPMFENSVPLLDFECDDIYKMLAALRTLKVDSRLISTVVRTMFISDGSAVKDDWLTGLFRSKSRFVERVLSTLHDSNTTKSYVEEWSKLQVFTDEKVIVQNCIDDRGQIIKGTRTQCNAVVVQTDQGDGFHIYMTHSYFERNKALDELQRRLSWHFRMNEYQNSHQIRMLGAILVTESTLEISEILDENGIPHSGFDSDEDDDDSDWAPGTGSNGFSYGWNQPPEGGTQQPRRGGKLREGDTIQFRVVTPANWDRCLHLFAAPASTGGRRRKEWDWAAADVGSPGVMFGVITPSDFPRADSEPWGSNDNDEDDDDDEDEEEHLKFLGELEVERMMKQIFGDKYVPREHWTSVRRERAGIEPYETAEGSDATMDSAFTIPDPEGLFAREVWRSDESVAKFIKRRPKRWLLDVKASYGPLSEGFTMDWKQFEKARKLTSMRPDGNSGGPGTGDVFAIIRVTNVGSSPAITIMIDPWQAYHYGRLMLECNGKIKAKCAQQATPSSQR